MSTNAPAISDVATAAEVQRDLGPQGRLASVRRFVRWKPVGAASAGFILLVVFMAVFAPLIAPYDPTQTMPADNLQAPSLSHPFGTDAVGRDVFSRIAHGARVSLLVGVTSVTLAVIVGTAAGAASAYFGGLFDLLFQRFIDALLALPLLIIALALVSALGRQSGFIMLAIAIGIFPNVSRVARSVTLTVKQEPYVDAAVSLGASQVRVMALHILPNIVPPLLVISTTLLGAAIVVESALGFLGLGTQPPAPSWGNMIGGSARFELQSAPWLVWAPSLAISLTVLSFNLLGDALRDVLDPRLRGSR